MPIFSVATNNGFETSKSDTCNILYVITWILKLSFRCENAAQVKLFNWKMKTFHKRKYLVTQLKFCKNANTKFAVATDLQEPMPT